MTDEHGDFVAPFKKYILFKITHYYPSGGLGDIEGEFDTLEGAKEFAQKKLVWSDWVYIVDRDTWKVVWEK